MIFPLVAEATEYDFKSELERDKPISWLKSVSAFANGIGGTLFFGVGNDGKIIGLKDAQSDAEFISRRIKDRITPLPNFILTSHFENDKSVLTLEVKAGRSTPYYYSADGRKTAYVRIGNESVPAPDHILNELILKGTNRTFDAISTEHKKEDYSFTLLEATYLQRTRLRFEQTDYHSFGLITDDKFLTRAGSLLTDQHIVYNSRIFCTRWNGLKKGSIFDDALDDREYEGNLIYLLGNGCDFIKNNTKVRFEKTAAGRIDKPDYSDLAVIEILVNALIHRDYLIIGSEIHIDIYDDRLEVSSPGGMFNGKMIQEQEIDKLKSERRNPIIADLFHRMRYMERRGSGLNKIVEETQKLPGYDERFMPAFYSTISSFTVILKNVNYSESQTENRVSDGGINGGLKRGINGGLCEAQQKIIALLLENPMITTQTIADSLNLTRRKVEYHISQLKESGFVEREGAKKNGRWIVRSIRAAPGPAHTGTRKATPTARKAASPLEI
ncbi:MAG: putative DNA binding domain-containing protein [Clostridiales bacterium]|jgi:ATP-dependent DNA helicase RecG|nr:putative DNA binding domain-containing protein [Clostridiales bacterium]